jgi:hypothetical protein
MRRWFFAVLEVGLLTVDFEYAVFFGSGISRCSAAFSANNEQIRKKTKIKKCIKNP